MERIRTVEAEAHVEERVFLQGWLHAVRRLGGVNFILLRDGWGVIQAVTEDEADLAPLEGLAEETVIALEGVVVRSAQAPGGRELHHPRVHVIMPVVEPPPAPLYKRQLNVRLPTMLDHAVVLNRHPRRRAIFRLAAGAMGGFRATLDGRHFTEIQTPKIVASATESGANVFAVDYQGQPAFLAQSPQFYKQIMVGVFERVYEVGPVFRAEPHNTSRHANEYVSLDAEMGFIEDHFDVMAVVRDVVAGILAWLSERYQDEVDFLGAALPPVPAEIPHIHFAEAGMLLRERYGAAAEEAPGVATGEPDLSPHDERRLGAWAKEEYGSDFLFVTGYPMIKRPFYTHPEPERPEYSNSFDLLFRGMELITGGQRRHRYEDYKAALTAANLSPEPFAAYLEAFRHGMPPHGGFAIGLERLLMQLLGVGNVRLTTLFPRDRTRLTP